MTDLDQVLRDAGRDISLRVPLDEITSRGETLRRRRRIRGAGVITVCAVVAASGVLMSRSGGGTPNTHLSTTHASLTEWSPLLVGIPSDTLADYAALCRANHESGRDVGPDQDHGVFNDPPVASAEFEGPSGVLATLAFRRGSVFADCVLDTSQDRGPTVVAQETLPRFDDAGAFVTPAGTYGSTDLTFAFGATLPTVDAVQIMVDGTTIDAAVDNGVYAAIMPTSATRDLPKATVDAFDSAGVRLARVPLLP